MAYSVKLGKWKLSLASNIEIPLYPQNLLMYKVIHFPNSLSLLHIHLYVQACITATSHPSEE